ncbi:unnamed protein product [Didymodactylos carnosus]|uniref:Cyclin-dependent kinase 5 activator n=1 Tax=Didymodactylos carnosus TaxID=1234261 RepID=A0A813XJJ7_9BILA|nr:unnamed protein product [Didymodactylos carnosus]CAF0874101.1 unnamed protein product [Didymodactylos carnosus]CAF3579706.1 unnamed protein product [Didymodactylos carnosus]CAF3661285.1 unnamed protein product [Didymodactylos carnosus]
MGNTTNVTFTSPNRYTTTTTKTLSKSTKNYSTSYHENLKQFTTTTNDVISTTRTPTTSITNRSWKKQLQILNETFALKKFSLKTRKIDRTIPTIDNSQSFHELLREKKLTNIENKHQRFTMFDDKENQNYTLNIINPIIEFENSMKSSYTRQTNNKQPHHFVKKSFSLFSLKPLSNVNSQSQPVVKVKSDTQQQQQQQQQCPFMDRTNHDENNNNVNKKTFDICRRTDKTQTDDRKSNKRHSIGILSMASVKCSHLSKSQSQYNNVKCNGNNIKKTSQTTYSFSSPYTENENDKQMKSIPELIHAKTTYTSSSSSLLSSASSKRSLSSSSCLKRRDRIIPKKTIIQASTTELLRCFGDYLSQQCSHLNNLDPSDCILWLKSADRSLIIQGWQEDVFINPANVVFVYLIVRETLQSIIHYSQVSTVYELQSIVLTCLYLAFSYMGNEITYPLKPFIIENNRDLFWKRVVLIMERMSSKMLLINKDPKYFTEIFSELKSFSLR